MVPEGVAIPLGLPSLGGGLGALRPRGVGAHCARVARRGGAHGRPDGADFRFVGDGRGDDRRVFRKAGGLAEEGSSATALQGAAARGRAEVREVRAEVDGDGGAVFVDQPQVLELALHGRGAVKELEHPSGHLHEEGSEDMDVRAALAGHDEGVFAGETSELEDALGTGDEDPRRRLGDLFEVGLLGPVRLTGGFEAVHEGREAVTVLAATSDEDENAVVHLALGLAVVDAPREIAHLRPSGRTLYGQRPDEPVRGFLLRLLGGLVGRHSGERLDGVELREDLQIDPGFGEVDRRAHHGLSGRETGDQTPELPGLALALEGRDCVFDLGEAALQPRLELVVAPGVLDGRRERSLGVDEGAEVGDLLRSHVDLAVVSEGTSDSSLGALLALGGLLVCDAGHARFARCRGVRGSGREQVGDVHGGIHWKTSWELSRSLASCLA